MRKSNLFIGFVAVVLLLVLTMMAVLQSKYFARAMVLAIHRYIPFDLGVDGNFSELTIKLVPPGVVLQNPSILLKKNNPAGLPEGTQINAKSIDVTFQLFQLLTGSVNINAAAIYGATLKLELDKKFIDKQTAKLGQKGSSSSVPINLNWNQMIKFNFRSFSLIDSQIDLTFLNLNETKKSTVKVQAFAKELTIGKSTVDKYPSYDLVVDLQKAFVDVFGKVQSLAQLQGSIEISKSGFSIRSLGIQENDLNFHTHGNVLGDLLNLKSLKSDLNFIVKGPLEQWVKPEVLGQFTPFLSKSGLKGELSAEGNFKGDLLSPEDTAQVRSKISLFQVNYDGWKFDEVSSSFEWLNKKLNLNDFLLKLDDGTLGLQNLSYDFKSESHKFSTTVQLNKINFRKLMGRHIRKVFPLHMVISGTSKIEGSYSKDIQGFGSLDLKVDDFAFKTGSPDSLAPQKILFSTPPIHLVADYKFSKDGFFFDQTKLSLPKSSLSAKGAVGPKTGFDIHVNGDVDLIDFGKFGPFPIAGKGNVIWTIKGVLPDVELQFDLAAENAKYLNLNLGKVNGRITYKDNVDTVFLENLAGNSGRSTYIANGSINVGKTEDVHVNVGIDHATIQDFAKVFSNFIEKSVPWYPQDLVGNLAGNIAITGKTDTDKLSAIATVNLQNVDLKHEIFRSGSMKAGFVKGSYIAKDVNLKKKNGLIQGAIEFDSAEKLNFNFKTESFSTADIDLLMGLGITYKAPIKMTTQGSGSVDSLESLTEVSVADGALKSAHIPSSSIKLQTSKGRLTLKSDLMGGQFQGSVDYGFKGGSPSAVDFQFKKLNPVPVLMALNSDLASDSSLFGIIEGGGSLKFLTGKMSKLSGALSLNSFKLSKRGLDFALQKPLNLNIKNGFYDFSNLNFISNDAVLSVHGRSDSEQINYELSGKVNLSLAEFLTSEIASFKGFADFQASIFGRADNPSFKGKIKSNNADLRMKVMEQPFEGLSFSTEFNDSKIKFNEMFSNFAGGNIKGSGTAELYLSKVPDLEVNLDINNAKVKVFPVAYARVNGKMNVTGSSLPYLVKANLKVADALIKENFNINEGARVLKSSKFLPNKFLASDGEYHLFELDMNLNADNNVFVKNDLFDTELKGSIKVINTIQTPRLLGNASVIHGKIIFKNNFFVVQSGSIRFNNPAVLDPEFDLNAQTEMKGYKVNLVATGSVSDYKLSFQSQPPLSQNDIVNLLTLGVTSNDYQNISRENRDAYSRDEMYGLIFSQSGVNRSLKEKFGLNVRVDQSENIVPDNVFRAKSSDQAGTVAPKVVLQKEITKNLNATVGTTVGVGEATERNLGVEYGVNKYFSVIGVYQDQNAPQLRQSRTSLGLDLKFKKRF